MSRKQGRRERPQAENQLIKVETYEGRFDLKKFTEEAFFNCKPGDVWGIYLPEIEHTAFQTQFGDRARITDAEADAVQDITMTYGLFEDLGIRGSDLKFAARVNDARTGRSFGTTLRCIKNLNRKGFHPTIFVKKSDAPDSKSDRIAVIGGRLYSI